MAIQNLYQALVIMTLFASSPLSALSLYPPYRSDRTRQSYISVGRNGGISAAHPLASKAGIRTLRKGGNAIDALVASSFVISVVRPHSTGIGGGGFALFFNAKNKDIQAFDFRERAPLAASKDMYLDDKGKPVDFIYKGKTIKNASVNGHLSVATPGLVKGLLDLHKKYGTIDLKELLKPAIKIAKEGFPIYKSLATTLERRKDMLWAFEANRKVFFNGKKVLKEGDLLIQKDLARTIELIAKGGSEVFYTGKIAKAITQEMKKSGGILNMTDFKKYRTLAREPIQGEYEGYNIFSMPPPSSGGVHIVEMLNILKNKKITEFKPQTVAYYNLLAETMKHAYADRAKYLGDPDFVRVPTKGLTSKKYANEIAKKITIGKAVPANKIRNPNPQLYESPSTTHISIVDKFGNAISSTQTINYSFGSCVMVPGYGIILNDEMDDFSKKPGVANIFGLVGSKANEIQPSKTMLSSMTPTIVTKDKKVELVLGAPGGSRIINAVLQTTLLRLGFKETLEDSVHAYRIHNQWLPDQLYYEKNGLTQGQKNKLQSIGYSLNETNFYIGDIQAISRFKNGWKSVSDTRSDGKPESY